MWREASKRVLSGEPASLSWSSLWRHVTSRDKILNLNLREIMTRFISKTTITIAIVLGILFANLSAISSPFLKLGEELHILNVRMLTLEGENAEAYFNPDGSLICWQSKSTGMLADQIYVMPSSGGVRKLISTGFGKTTCSFFIPRTTRLVYCSTHDYSPEPPLPPDPAAGYVWNLDEYDIYTVNMNGQHLQRLTNLPGYDAEAAVSPDGSQIVFTSQRHGDLDIYVMDVDGSNQRQLTFTRGYDGGPFFSPDGEWIVFRSHLPENDEEMIHYNELLIKNVVEPMRFEIQIMRPDGSERRQITDLGVASFAPYMHPDGKRIIFCSNHKMSGEKQPKGKPLFNLFMINIDGTGLKQITYNDSFDGFPMFSNDGKKLIWASNRHSPEPGSTNIFIADWID